MILGAASVRHYRGCFCSSGEIFLRGFRSTDSSRPPHKTAHLVLNGQREVSGYVMNTVDPGATYPRTLVHK